jgi:hypothetical protein
MNVRCGAKFIVIAFKRMWSTTFPSPNFGSAFLFSFFFFKIERLAVTFQTANGQAIAQRDEIEIMTTFEDLVAGPD